MKVIESERPFVLCCQNITMYVNNALVYLGPYSPTILNNILGFFFSPKFTNWTVKQLLIGCTVRFSQSDVVLHSNASKYRKILESKTKNGLKNGW